MCTYESLNTYTESLRKDFKDIEEKAMDLTECKLYKEKSGRKRKRNTQYDEDCGSSTQDPIYISLSASEKYRIEIFNVILDQLSSALKNRKNAYTKISDIFGPFRDFHRKFKNDSEKTEYLKKMSKKIIESYPDDIEDCLEDELIQFLNILENPLYSSKINRDNDAKMSVKL